MNPFKKALQIAMNKEGEVDRVYVSSFENHEPVAVEMISGKEATVGKYAVEWHNRWCFYRYGRKGKEFLADYKNGKFSCDSINRMKPEEWKHIQEAVAELLQ